VPRADAGPAVGRSGTGDHGRELFGGRRVNADSVTSDEAYPHRECAILCGATGGAAAAGSRGYFGDCPSGGRTLDPRPPHGLSRARDGAAKDLDCVASLARQLAPPDTSASGYSRYIIKRAPSTIISAGHRRRKKSCQVDGASESAFVRPMLIPATE
jgi:hypothetical protein